MTTDETQAVVHTLTLAFPNLADDVGRCRDISRRLEPYPRDVARQAVDEYIRLGDARWFEISRLMPVVDRMEKQRKERESENLRLRRLHEAKAEEDALRDALNAADEQIARMTDEQVMATWRPLLERLSGKPREWAEQWGPEKVRRNHMLRLKIAGGE
jgi:PAS domain-containing protein